MSISAKLCNTQMEAIQYVVSKYKQGTRHIRAIYESNRFIEIISNKVEFTNIPIADQRNIKVQLSNEGICQVNALASGTFYSISFESDCIVATGPGSIRYGNDSILVL